MAFFLLISFIVNGAGLEFLIVYSLSAFLSYGRYLFFGIPLNNFLGYTLPLSTPSGT
jgi:hypothetical protein